MLDSIRIVLVRTSHPGNIGAAARAMKVMGLEQLTLVDPLHFPHQEATSRASGADDLLANARVVGSLAEAISGCDKVYGTSARQRSLEWPQCNGRECAEQIALGSYNQVAIVFGHERTGLTNEELAICQTHVVLPTEPHFSSLNLAAAVQVVAYELKMASLLEASEEGADNKMPNKEEPLATADEVYGLVEHFKITMTELGYLDPSHPKLLIQRLQRLLNRATLEKTEINILRGFLSAVQKRLNF